jgi:hypothetical protein
MDRSIPQFNRHLFKKWRDKDQALLEHNIANCKSGIDNSPPQSMAYPILKGKRD